MEILEKQDIVYFIQTDDTNKYIKIGFTNDLKARLTALQTGNPYTLKVLHIIPGGLRLEQVIHNKFEHLRVNKEWFKPEKELLEYIELIKDKTVLKFIEQTYQLNFHQVKSETKELLDQLSAKILESDLDYPNINSEQKIKLLTYSAQSLSRYNTLALETYKSIGERQESKWRQLRGALKSCLDRFDRLITKQ